MTRKVPAKAVGGRVEGGGGEYLRLDYLPLDSTIRDRDSLGISSTPLHLMHCCTGQE